MESKIIDLCQYRMGNAKDTLDTAKLYMEHQHYRDIINRCYYTVFYTVKAVLASEEIDFKRHKDAVAHFNKNYVADIPHTTDTHRKRKKFMNNIACIIMAFGLGRRFDGRTLTASSITFRTDHSKTVMQKTGETPD